MRSQFCIRFHQLLLIVTLKTPAHGKPPEVCELPWLRLVTVNPTSHPSKVLPLIKRFFAILISIMPLGALPVFDWVERGSVVGEPPVDTQTCSVEAKFSTNWLLCRVMSWFRYPFHCARPGASGVCSKGLPPARLPSYVPHDWKLTVLPLIPVTLTT